jgi:hypothetical protein
MIEASAEEETNHITALFQSLVSSLNPLGRMAFDGRRAKVRLPRRIGRSATTAGRMNRISIQKLGSGVAVGSDAEALPRQSEPDRPADRIPGSIALENETR